MKTVDGGKEIPVQTMLSMKRLLSDGIQGMRAVDHIEHLEKVLKINGKKMSNVICLVGNNCSLNQSMAQIMKVPLLDCASHKFDVGLTSNLICLQLSKGEALLQYLCYFCCVLCACFGLVLLLTMAVFSCSHCSFTGRPLDEKGKHSQDSITAPRPDIVLCCERE